MSRWSQDQILVKLEFLLLAIVNILQVIIVLIVVNVVTAAAVGKTC